MTAMTTQDYEDVVSAVKQFETPWLRDLQSIVSAQLKSREKQDIQQARIEIMRIAQSVGMDVKDLIRTNAAPGPKKGTATIKFRHPDDPMKQWSGRGLAPKWFKAWEAAGKSVDDLRVG